MFSTNYFSMVEKQAFHPVGSTERRSFAIGARLRTATVYRGAGRCRAIFIVLHGSRSNGAQVRAYSGHAFDRLADSEACVVAYPDGFERHWNDGRVHAGFSAVTNDIDDVAFLRALAGVLCEEHGLPPSAVFVAGFSNGGHMAYRLLAEMPDRIGGAVIVGANCSYPGHVRFELNRLCRPVLLVGGDRDPINPYWGGRTTLFGFGYRGTVLGAEESAAMLARLGRARQGDGWVSGRTHACDDTAVSSIDHPCEGDVHVRLLRMHGAGHTIPQPYAQMPRLLGKTVHVIDIARYAWDFFRMPRLLASTTTETHHDHTHHRHSDLPRGTSVAAVLHRLPAKLDTGRHRHRHSA